MTDGGVVGVLLFRSGLPVSLTMINMQDFNTVFADSVYNQIRCALYYPLTRTGKVSATSNAWIVRQGLARIPYPLCDDLSSLGILLCDVSLRFD